MKPKPRRDGNTTENVSASLLSAWPVINTAGVLVLLADMQIIAI